MDSLKKLGELCKHHYEKLILIIALVVLAVAVAYLYMENEKEKEKIKEFFTQVRSKPGSPVQPANLTNYNSVLATLQNPPSLDFGLPHYLLNPVKWKETPQGDLIKLEKGTESGIDLLDIANILPLNFTIAFERKAGPGYWINITNEVVVPGQSGRRIAQFASVNATNTKVFILRDIKGPPPPEDPTQEEEWSRQVELVLELKESGERVTVSKEKPFIRAEAYQADLRYPPENKTFLKQRVGAQLSFGGEDYRIVAINQNEVVFLEGNDKKHTKRYNPNAPPAAATPAATSGTTPTSPTPAGTTPTPPGAAGSTP
jgi:hypothetical protein